MLSTWLISFQCKLYATPIELHIKRSLSIRGFYLSSPFLTIEAKSNPILTQHNLTQPKFGLYTKNDCRPPNHPPPQCWRYLSCQWPDFNQTLKSRLLGSSWTDFKCLADINPGIICPGDICPYREYLSCYWPNFDWTFWAKNLFGTQN